MSNSKNDRVKMKDALQHTYEKVLQQIAQGNFIPKMDAYVKRAVDNFMLKSNKLVELAKEHEAREPDHTEKDLTPEHKIQAALSRLSEGEQKRISLSLSARAAVDLYNRTWRDFRDDITLGKTMDAKANLDRYWELMEKLNTVHRELANGRQSGAITQPQWAEAAMVAYKQLRVLGELKIVLAHPWELEVSYIAEEIDRADQQIQAVSRLLNEYAAQIDWEKLSIENSKKLAHAKSFLKQGKVIPEPKLNGDARELSWSWWYFVILNQNEFHYKTMNSADTAYRNLISGIQ